MREILYWNHPCSRTCSRTMEVSKKIQTSVTQADCAEKLECSSFFPKQSFTQLYQMFFWYFIPFKLSKNLHRKTIVIDVLNNLNLEGYINFKHNNHALILFSWRTSTSNSIALRWSQSRSLLEVTMKIYLIPIRRFKKRWTRNLRVYNKLLLSIQR